MAKKKPEALAIRRKITGVLLQGARLRAGKSKSECAQAIGVATYTITRFENGLSDISLPQLELLAFAWGVSASSFFNSDEQTKLVTEERELPAERVVELRQRIIGVLLRKARTEAGQSKKDVAKVAGVGTTMLTYYESGDRPIPLSKLQEMAEYLKLPVTYFLDEGVGRIGEREQLHNQFERFSDLPVDVREFVSHYINLPYIRVAMRLSSMETDRIRSVAEGLLDITY